MEAFGVHGTLSGTHKELKGANKSRMEAIGVFGIACETRKALNETELWNTAI